MRMTVIALVAVAAQAQNPLLRHYRPGERLIYHMKGVNEQWRYEADAEGVVKKAADGTFFEEYVWSNFLSGGQKAVLSSATLNFRQEVTLDPDRKQAFPNLSQADPRLVGPLTDFLTFYVDLWLAAKTGRLLRPGDHFYFQRGTPNSWADGTQVLAAQSSIDFDLSFEALDRSANTATVVVRHVPPEQPQLDLPADWMRTPVTGGANNWFQVKKRKDGKYDATVGRETFDVTLKVSATDGRILSAIMENTVVTAGRECGDAALHSCGEAKPHTISRHIEIGLVLIGDR